MTAVSRRPPVRSDWNLPGILLGPRRCAFSRFDIDRTSGSQVTAILVLFQCWKGVYMAAEGVVPPSHLIMPFLPKLKITRRPPVRSDWNLPGILPGPRGCAFSRFDIDRTSGSQVTAIYLSTNDRTRCYDITNDVTINVYLIIIIIIIFTLDVTIILLLRLVWRHNRHWRPEYVPFQSLISFFLIHFNYFPSVSQGLKAVLSQGLN